MPVNPSLTRMSAFRPSLSPPMWIMSASKADIETWFLIFSMISAG